jgi:hypothetical protein
MIFLLVALTFPKESVLMLIKTCMSPISQQEQAQCVKRKVGEAGIN